jgi:hypothetical protein
MAYEITNTTRGPSIIRVVDPGTVTVNIANLAVDANETVSAASIKRVMWSTNGAITITRNAVPVLQLHGQGDMVFPEIGHSLANTNTGTVVITIATGGTAIIEMSKTANYTTALTGI